MRRTACRSLALSALAALALTSGGCSGDSATSPRNRPGGARLLMTGITGSGLTFTFADGSRLRLDFTDIGCSIAELGCNRNFGLSGIPAPPRCGVSSTEVSCTFPPGGALSGTIRSTASGDPGAYALAVDLESATGKLALEARFASSGGSGQWSFRGKGDCPCASDGTFLLERG